jgi:hypothetical protein
MNIDKNKYKVYKLPHPLMLHWIINPGLAINEVILGQRIPCVIVTEKDKSKPLMERQYFPCKKCGTYNDARLWSKKNALGHWFGYICPHCGEKIPCLWNITSIIILTFTFPIWIWIKIKFEKNWLEKEKLRLSDFKIEALPTVTKPSWIKMCIIFGSLIFVFMNIGDIIRGDIIITYILINFIVSMFAGFAFGFTMKFIMSKSKYKFRF